jgi:hypothetical protein
MKLKRLMALSLAVCTAAAPTFAFAADSPAGATGATPAPTKADLTTPKGAALSFGNALLAGDNAGLRATSLGSDNDYKILESLGTMVSAMKKLSDAAAEKFGKDNVISKSGKDMDIAAELEKSEVKVDGDSATIINKDKPDDKNPMKLKKVGSDWKVDLASLPKEGMDQLTKMAPAMAKVAAEVTKEIKDGKYAKAEDANTALGQKMFAAMMQAPPPQQP